MRFRIALLSIVGLLFLSGCQDPAPAPSISTSPVPEVSPAIEETEIVPTASVPPYASVDDIPEELLAELLGIGAECPACGKAAWAIQSLDCEAEEFAYKRPCGHGGYPWYNDVATVVTGQCTAACASCGHTETLDMDEDIMYCPYENRYSENKAF